MTNIPSSSGSAATPSTATVTNPVPAANLTATASNPRPATASAAGLEHPKFEKHPKFKGARKH